jgi:hypothetical protein
MAGLSTGHTRSKLTMANIFHCTVHHRISSSRTVQMTSYATDTVKVGRLVVNPSQNPRFQILCNTFPVMLQYPVADLHKIVLQ